MLKLIRCVIWGTGVILIVFCGFQPAKFLLAQEQNLKTQKEYSREELKKRILKEKDRVPIWIEMLKDPSWVVRGGVIRELSQSKDPRAIEPLAKAMVEDSDKGIRRMAAQMLSGFNDKRILPIFKKQVLENGEHKIIGAEVLMELGNKEEKKIALPVLEKYAEEGHPEVLSYTKFIWPKGEKGIVKAERVYYDKSRAEKILRKLINHKDELARAEAVYYLCTDWGDKKTAELEVEKILQSNDPRAVDIGKAILEAIGDEKSMRRLQELEYPELRKLREEEERKEGKR